MHIQGGTFQASDFANLNAIRDQARIHRCAQAKVPPEVADLAARRDEKRKNGTGLRGKAYACSAFEQMEQISKRNPVSIYPILVYLEKKKYEVFNLRALARGKESKLLSDKIAEYLVM